MDAPSLQRAGNPRQCGDAGPFDVADDGDEVLREAMEKTAELAALPETVKMELYQERQRELQRQREGDILKGKMAGAIIGFVILLIVFGQILQYFSH